MNESKNYDLKEFDNYLESQSAEHGFAVSEVKAAMNSNRRAIGGGMLVPTDVEMKIDSIDFWNKINENAAAPTPAFKCIYNGVIYNVPIVWGYVSSLTNFEKKKGVQLTDNYLDNRSYINHEVTSTYAWDESEFSRLIYAGESYHDYNARLYCMNKEGLLNGVSIVVHEPIYKQSRAFETTPKTSWKPRKKGAATVTTAHPLTVGKPLEINRFNETAKGVD